MVSSLISRSKFKFSLVLSVTPKGVKALTGVLVQWSVLGESLPRAHFLNYLLRMVIRPTFSYN